MYHIFKKNVIFIKSLSSISIKVLSAALSMILLVLLAKIMNEREFGLYTTAIAFITILSMPISMGLSTLIVRNTAYHYEKKEFSSIKALWVWCFYVIIIPVVLLVLIACGLLISNDSQLISSSVNYLTIACLFLALFMGLTDISASAIKGLGYVILGQIPSLIMRPLLLALFLFTFYISVITVSAREAILLHVLASLCALVSVNCFIINKVDKNILRVKEKHFQSALWRKSVLPLTMASGLQLLNSQLDIVMVGYFTNLENVAYYKAASSISMLVVFGLHAMQPIISQKIAVLFAKREINGILSLNLTGVAISSLVSVPLVLIILFQGDMVLTYLFGESYTKAYLALNILSIGQLVNSIFGFGVSILIMINKEGKTLISLIAATILNILGNVILIPIFGIEGAAISTAITTISLSLFIWYFIYKYFFKKHR